MERRHNTRHAAALAAAAAASSNSPERPDLEKEKEEESPTSEGSTSDTVGINKREMYERFKRWAMKTYGDSAKTKTVTRKKYSRITKILKGEEHSNAENSKFRFWVKAKGFRIGPPIGQRSEGGRSDQLLYVPCTKLSPGTGKEDTVYKKVAVVENFFNIIYEVHVGKDIRGGKHAGQKRTYKTIAETYAFLPREAVTHFLMSCADCQKRMHVATECDGKSGYYGNKDRRVRSGTNSPGSGSPVIEESNTSQLTTDIDYNLPITTTYLKRMRSLGFSKEEALNFDREEIASNTESESSENETAAPPTIDGVSYSTMTEANGAHQISQEDEDRKDRASEEVPNEEIGSSPKDTPLDMSGLKRENDEAKCSEEEPINMIKTADNSDHYQSLHYWTNSNTETSATPDGIKEDEDDDEEDDTDKIDVNAHDPERLKAFNMFVRLFIDENLDRMVPISRQPKDKIQAIIDSCTRQFPEFSDRARKRIRTYLKSCRRTKRARDHNGWDFDRSAPHLSSPLAEQILSIACDNESQNAKRMRLGLKPISVSLSEIDRPRSGIPSSSTMTSYTEAANNTSRFTATSVRNPFVPPQESQLHAQFTKPIQHSLLQTNRKFPASMSSQTSVAPTRIKIVNGVTCESQPSSNSLLSSSVTYRGLPQFHIAVTETTTSHSKNLHQVTLSSGTLANGPTDLTVKKPSIPRYSLNPNEANAVRQLIAGYRESATFLLRSADELEQLLMQQN